MYLQSGVCLIPSLIDDSTTVNQRAHTLGFQPIACRGINNKAHGSEPTGRSGKTHSSEHIVVYTRTSSWQKKSVEIDIVAMASVHLMNVIPTGVRESCLFHFQSLNEDWKNARNGLKRVVEPTNS